MKLFFFWTTLVVVFGSWNIAKYYGHDQVEMVKSAYVEHFGDKREYQEKVQPKVWPDTFEHLHKRTE